MAKRRRFIMADNAILEQKIDNLAGQVQSMQATLMMTVGHLQETIASLEKKVYPSNSKTANSLYGLPYWNKAQEQEINSQQARDN